MVDERRTCCSSSISSTDKKDIRVGRESYPRAGDTSIARYLVRNHRTIWRPKHHFGGLMFTMRCVRSRKGADNNSPNGENQRPKRLHKRPKGGMKRKEEQKEKRAIFFSNYLIFALKMTRRNERKEDPTRTKFMPFNNHNQANPLLSRPSSYKGMTLDQRRSPPPAHTGGTRTLTGQRGAVALERRETGVSIASGQSRGLPPGDWLSPFVGQTRMAVRDYICRRQKIHCHRLQCKNRFITTAAYN